MRPDSLNDRLAYRRHVGEQIRNRRLAANLTQQALAESAGLEKQAISHIENGHASPRLDTVWRLAQALGVGVADLVRE
ncbi:helix-turn-helix domain-containing protein [Streptomyces sp. NBC_00984]|uniref:helix-turn-helix domain-containing protein n=1 Tax=Streptomyces sp. NBC_00984 TaxID=2903700 RepID=UPI003863A7E4|nr:helix-turn-helix domain-containing protein [Streptomyces sp. NBC_00984]